MIVISADDIIRLAENQHKLHNLTFHMLSVNIAKTIDIRVMIQATHILDDHEHVIPDKNYMEITCLSVVQNSTALPKMY